MKTILFLMSFIIIVTCQNDTNNTEFTHKNETSSINNTNNTSVYSTDEKYKNDTTIIKNKRLSLFYLEKCTSDSDCRSMNSCINFECRHNTIDITFRNVLSLILLFLGIAFSSALGLGGGNIIQPLLLLMLNFYIKQAIPLSKTLILVSSLTSFTLHLADNNPLNLFLDYNSSLVIIPGILLGSSVGIIINKMLHSILLLSIMSVFLFIFAVKSLFKYFLYEKYEENKDNEDIPLQEINIYDSNNVSQYYSKKDESLDSLVVKDYKFFSFKKIALILIPFILFLIFNIVIKNSDFFNRYNICDFNYYYSIFVLILMMIACLVMNGLHLISEFEERKQNNYKFNRSDLRWNWYVILKFFITGILVGFISSSVGIGGGVIIAPLLLDMGLKPYNTTHVTNFIVLFTSLSTVLQFYFQDSLVYDNTLVLILLTFLASLTGNLIIKLILQKTKKEHLIILILSIVLFISGISMVVFSVLKIYQRQYKNSIFGFAEICDNSMNNK